MTSSQYGYIAFSISLSDFTNYFYEPIIFQNLIRTVNTARILQSVIGSEITRDILFGSSG